LTKTHHQSSADAGDVPEASAMTVDDGRQGLGRLPRSTYGVIAIATVLIIAAASWVWIWWGEHSRTATTTSTATSAHSADAVQIQGADDDDSTRPLLPDSSTSARDESSKSSKRGVPIKQRVQSLDVFRGFNIALMIFVDMVGSSFPSIHHSPWDGIRLADFVMPFFDFMVSVRHVYESYQSCYSETSFVANFTSFQVSFSSLW
jgi:hypothetical protein